MGSRNRVWRNPFRFCESNGHVSGEALCNLFILKGLVWRFGCAMKV
jgi:hypothetical protein